MEQLPTAEEFLLCDYDASSKQEGGSVFTQDAIEKMIEFTKLHVEAALEKYIQETEIKRVLCNYPPINFINKDDLRKAYPLENIK